MSRIISWFSCGAASTIATKLEPESLPTYCETGAEHPDNERYFSECESWFGRPIKRLRSGKYLDTWHVWEKHRYLSGINGAKCTVELKVVPRLVYQRPDDVHVFGYTADSRDVARADLLRSTYPELTIRTPLIERGLNKESCIEMVRRAGLGVPPLYAMGFQNNNCIPCVKAQSPAYWALVRKEFPAQFERMAKLSRKLKVRLCKIDGERAFIDEISGEQETTNPIVPSCDFLCHIAESDLAA